MTAIVDFHIHLYRGYNLNEVEIRLRENSKRRFPRLPASTPLVLCLTERQGQYWFRNIVNRTQEFELLPAHWNPLVSADGDAMRFDLADGPLIWVAGRQIITEERLELLCLTKDADIPDGIPLREGIAAIVDLGGVPVVPWSPGKWMARRGEILSRVLGEQLGLFLGDTAIRPGKSWDRAHFDKSLLQQKPILPGSDPLPAKGEMKMFGKLSAVIDIPANEPATELRNWMKKVDHLEYEGSGLGVIGMMNRMLNYRINKTPV